MTDTPIRGYTEELDRIHLSFDGSPEYAFCGVRLYVVYLSPVYVPLKHPNICHTCRARIPADTIPSPPDT